MNTIKKTQPDDSDDVLFQVNESLTEDQIDKVIKDGKLTLESLIFDHLNYIKSNNVPRH